MRHIYQFADPHLPADDSVLLDFQSRSKSRQHVKFASGADGQLLLDRGSILRGGDKLLTEEGQIIAVIAAPEPLHEATTDDKRLLCCAAYHMGNRHVSLQIGDRSLRFLQDEVLANMLRQMGLTVSTIEAPFEPESGAYAHGAHAAEHGDNHQHSHQHNHEHDTHQHDHQHQHGHAHTHGHQDYPPKIHDYAQQ